MVRVVHLVVNVWDKVAGGMECFIPNVGSAMVRGLYNVAHVMVLVRGISLYDKNY